MFCWQPSHQSKQHPIYPNRSIQNTSDTNSACCCAGWSWKLRKDFKAKWNREIMVISNRNIIFQIPFWGSRIDLGDVNVRQLDPFKRLGSPLYSLPGSLWGFLRMRKWTEPSSKALTIPPAFYLRRANGSFMLPLKSENEMVHPFFQLQLTPFGW